MGKEKVTVSDLHRIYIRAQDEETGEWKTINVLEATSHQFDVWAKP
jgi:hypothetical protein